MSQRPPVDHQRIEAFLRRLGTRFRGSGRVYLVGGTTMVLSGYRARTLDIDLAFEVDPEKEGEFLQTIRELKDELSTNVELASPGDFIPLPAGYRERSEFVGRFGQLDVFHFDLYSTALSKIDRGTEPDYEDVLALLRALRIEWRKLKTRFEEILPQMGKRSLKQDPRAFQARFEALRRKWLAQQDSGS